MWSKDHMIYDYINAVMEGTSYFMPLAQLSYAEGLS